MSDTNRAPIEKINGPFGRAWSTEVFVAAGALDNMSRLVRRMNLEPNSPDAVVAAAHLLKIAEEAGTLAAELTTASEVENVD